MPKATPEVRVRRAWEWECPNEHCRLINHEAEMVIWNAAGKSEVAKGRCVRCGQEVELKT